MKHPHRIREIARQAGLSEATVDRVLHNRGGVRESTAREVHRAIAALDRELAQTGSALPSVPVDVVVCAPVSWTDALREAFEAELPDLRPAVLEPRFHRGDPDVMTVLDRIGRSRTQGVILTAPDTPEIVEAVGQLGVPVVTLGVDLPAGKRIAYAGISHPGAGATAAYLVEQWLADRAGDVLVVPPPNNPGEPAELGADERAAGFRAEMAARAPNRRLLDTPGPSVRAIYAPAPGGTATVIDTFAAEHRNYDVFVAHGLDAANAELLRAGKLSAVLHEDLRAGVRHACLALLRARGLLSGPIRPHPPALRVITPVDF